MRSTLTFALLLVLLAPLPLPAQEEKTVAPVRVHLTDGRTVEGSLLDYGSRMYRVRGADGRIVEIPEEELEELVFLHPPDPAQIRELSPRERQQVEGWIEDLAWELPFEASPEQLEQLEEKMGRPLAREPVARRSLVEVGDPAVPLLVAVLERDGGAMLGTGPTPEGLRAINAAEALSRIASPAAVDAVLRAWREDPDLVELGAVLLATMGPEGLEALERGLAGVELPSALVAAESVVALGLRPVLPADLLRRGLERDDPEALIPALRLARHLRLRDAVPRVAALLDHLEPVAAAAADALTHILDPEAASPQAVLPESFVAFFVSGARAVRRGPGPAHWRLRRSRQGLLKTLFHEPPLAADVGRRITMAPPMLAFYLGVGNEHRRSGDRLEAIWEQAREPIPVAPVPVPARPDAGTAEWTELGLPPEAREMGATACYEARVPAPGEPAWRVQMVELDGLWFVVLVRQEEE